MAPTNDKASDLERRVSTRTSVRISLDALDEDYDFAAAGMVADGFRPREGSSSHTLSSGSSTLAPDDSSVSTTVPKSTPPSTTPKFQMVLNSSVSRDEPAALTRQATGSTESTVYQPSDGPYQGPSAPSHPYQMYPQNVRSARTMSTTTASTVTVPAAEASYSGPRGPSHPYTLYPQTDVIESEAAQAAAIPLGFSSLPDQYRRRTGPDGDDVADIIGPDGHTEQLPPYTRYPDEAYARKAAAMDDPLHDVPGGATVVPPIQTATASSMAPVPGAGGLGLATRNPEFESTDDLGTPQSRHSTRSFASDDSARGINLADGVEEKTTRPPKKWQLWMRRKLCGVVPYWALCLAGILLLIMAIVLGTVIGVFLRQRKPPPRKDTWEPTFGAAPTSVPNNLPALPLGTYAVPLMAVSTVSNTCFTNPGLSQAWNCLVSSGLHLTVSQGDHDYIASLNSNHTYTIANNVYSYGEQPPTIPRPVHLDLVNDKSEQGHGIAWYKLMAYNKTVILPEGWISSSSSSSNSQRKGRRDASASAGLANFKRKGIAQPGEKPWICNWPDTYLELYIYAQQNASTFPWPSSRMSTSTPSSSASSSATSSTSPTPSPAGAQGYYESSPHHWMPDDGSSFTRGYWPDNNPAHMPDHATADTQTTSTTTTQSTSTASTTGPFGPVDGGGTAYPTPPPRYPRVVKLEERRISTAGAPKAQCVQVEVQGPGQPARVLLDHDGNPVVIDIDEVEAVLPSGAPTPLPDPLQRLAKRSPTDISPCGCIWYLT